MVPKPTHRNYWCNGLFGTEAIHYAAGWYSGCKQSGYEMTIIGFWNSYYVSRRFYLVLTKLSKFFLAPCWAPKLKINQIKLYKFEIILAVIINELAFRTNYLLGGGLLYLIFLLSLQNNFLPRVGRPNNKFLELKFS